MRREAQKPFIHIAAGCLVNSQGEVLICQRPAHKLYPGEWELPGGKVEAGESAEQALRRELHEELGIAVLSCRPLIRVRHRYPELSVELDTWLVTGYDGEPRSTEHPAVAWVAPDQLPRWQLLTADRPIVNALRLPAHCIFTPPAFETRIVASLPALPPGLLRLRLLTAADEDYRRLASELADAGHRVVLDRDPADVARLGAAGFHATSRVLNALARRPVSPDYWFGASCHDTAELERARLLGADYAVLGPVANTVSHPEAPPLGWDAFAKLALDAGMPVYAIGGVGPEDLKTAQAHGAQGVAGISAYWRVLGSPGGSSSPSAGMA